MFMENDQNRAVDLSPDALEHFGEEESYWTVYRMFVVGDNLGRPWTMDEIFDYLSKNYDMTAEDPKTIQETLLDWAADLQTDARERLGIDGLFVHANGIYAFAERLNFGASAEARRSLAAEREARIALRDMVSRPVEASEFIDPVLRINRVIITTLKGFENGLARQSVLKRSVVSGGYDGEPEDLQPYIERLVEDGVLYKVRHGAIAYLSLTPIEVQTDTEESEIREKESLDIETSADILKVLCAPGTHYAQRLTMSALWRRINATTDKSVAIPDEQLAMLKKACRQLQSMGLVRAGGEKMGTGGGNRTKSAASKKRLRSASQHVYKAGLSSQGVKEEIQGVLNDGGLEAYLLERFE